MKIAGPSIRLSICVFVCLWTVFPLHAATAETLSLGDGLYLFRYGEQQSLFLVGDDRVIATDPLSNEAAKVYKAAVKAVTNKPITHVAYTSSFSDRVRGGAELAGQRAEFVAQENCKTNLNATPHPDAIVPTRTYTDKTSIDAGDASLDLYYFGQSYGTCLSVMIFRPANIMLVHGLVTPPVAKVPDDPTIANYYLHNLIRFFVYVEELAAAEGITSRWWAPSRSRARMKARTSNHWRRSRSSVNNASSGTRCCASSKPSTTRAPQPAPFRSKPT